MTGNATTRQSNGGPGAWARFKEQRESSIRDLKLSWYLFRKSPTSLLGAIIVGLFLILVAVGPAIVPFPQDAAGTVHIERKLTAPNSTHYFGTDELGRDIFTRVVLGARISLQIRVDHHPGGHGDRRPPWASPPATSAAGSARRSCGSLTCFCPSPDGSSPWRWSGRWVRAWSIA